MSLLRVGQLMFAASFIGLSIQGILMHDFSIGRPPAWPDTTARMIWSYVGGLVIILACVAVWARKFAAELTLVAGITILASIFLLRNIPDLFSKTLADAIWSLNAFKTLALAGGCFVVSVSFRPGRQTPLSQGLLWFGVISLAYFLFICGLAHFKFVDFIRGGFIPAYIPFKTFWTYFTGICLVGGGIGLLIKPVRKVAALMCGIMILGWFFLLHIPRMFVAPGDFMEWFGVFESFGFAGIFWVLREVYSS